MLCACGCGEETRVVKGIPNRFVAQHHHRRPAAERFWEKVDVRGPDECWEWQAGKCHYGHGQFTIKPKPPVKAHRWAWEYMNGKIPSGYHVHHECENPPCVNPSHLSLVTPGRHNTIHKLSVSRA